MCGIAGFLYDKKKTSINTHKIMSKMLKQIIHRGPDAEGIWQNDQGVSFGHRRLSIVDLSKNGDQPMISPSNRYVIIYNGEIYNHLELRKQLKIDSQNTQIWRGYSDTETLLSCIDFWGIKKTLKKCVGMFAFALWDKKEKSLYLARDRIGEKPLYYGWQNSVFLFGSELKALKEHPAFEGEIDRNSIMLQLRRNCIPAPYSIYKGIKKLIPGTFLKLSLEDKNFKQKQFPEPKKYWSFIDVAKNGIENQFVGDENSAISELDRLLTQSVAEQMIADVPLGAFLSGGVDSSTIVALMQKQSSVPVKTFSIGFNEDGYNEATHAKEVANYLKTDHTDLYVSPRQALDVIKSIPKFYDEPFSDSSQIPTFLVAKMTSNHVKVSLSGDGGDELFGGYNRYIKTQQWWNKIRVVPRSIRNLCSNALVAIPSKTWDGMSSTIPFLSANNILKLAGVLNVDHNSSLYNHFTTHWENPTEAVINGKDLKKNQDSSSFKIKSIVEQMMLLDSLSYLPDDILVKLDRAAMAVSLETRTPMLDYRVIEFAWKLPLSMKIRNGNGKFILRNLLYNYVPKNLIDRPKMGFGVPIDLWLRESLRDWAENLLDENRLIQEGYFDPKPILKKWDEHLSGKRNWQYHLWDVLMFQSWLEDQ